MPDRDCSASRYVSVVQKPVFLSLQLQPFMSHILLPNSEIVENLDNLNKYKEPLEFNPTYDDKNLQHLPSVSDSLTDFPWSSRCFQMIFVYLYFQKFESPAIVCWRFVQRGRRTNKAYFLVVCSSHKMSQQVLIRNVYNFHHIVDNFWIVLTDFPTNPARCFFGDVHW